MFSDLPGLFDRNFVVGFLLPAVVLVLISAFVLSLVAQVPMPGVNIDIAQRPWKVEITNPDRAGLALGMLSLGCLLAAVLLMVLNRPLVRLLEGYLYPVRWLHPLGRRGYRLLIEQVDLVERACILERRASGVVSPSTMRRYRELLAKRWRRYPDQESFVLPTAFGNAIRAAETYSRVMYGADIIALWPRLASVIDTEFRGQLDAARARLDCSVNVFYIMLLTLLIAIELAVTKWLPHARLHHWGYASLAIGTLALLVASFYRLSIVAATEWGTYLRSTSDIYLRPLLEKLGYTQPVIAGDRRRILEALSRGYLYLEALPPL